ncbi:MAG: DUF1579 family protein [Phycisphaerae bacterium]|nr:DUF1579 family protein [Phycisphaerae bacterium]
MNTTRIVVIGLFVTSFAIGGCGAPKFDMSKMQPADRPTELDKLDRLVGTWTGTAEMTAAGSDEVYKSDGKSVMTWEAGKRALLERFEYSMGDEDKMTGVSVYWWEPRDKKFHVWSTDSWGHIMTGTFTANADGTIWNFRTKSVDPASNSTSLGEGLIKFTNDNTQVWEWTEWDQWKTHKMMEMSGTTTRQ